jgi:hypothetical protein
MQELGLSGGEIFAYQVTGAATSIFRILAVTPEGKEVSLERTSIPPTILFLYLHLLGDGPADRPRQEVWFPRGHHG